MISDCSISAIPHRDTGFFSDLVTDYLDQKSQLNGFFEFSPDDDGLKKAIEARKRFPVNRTLLADTLKEQYAGYDLPNIVLANIEALRLDNTFTICTAHQPNLMTGYLYFVYKIIHTVKLARHLQAKYAQYNFVPVFYIGSEDNDFDELSVFRYGGIRYKWQTEQRGAVGRMKTDDIHDLIRQLFSLIGPPGKNADELKEIIETAYLRHTTITAATRYIVNALLGHMGVVVIDPDHHKLKQEFIPVLKQELLAPVAYDLVEKVSAQLNVHYKAQAFARPINLFYLKDDIRERIERNGDKWQVLKTDISWNQSDLIKEVEEYPERFSPNVILRGVFQETILPDIAFIGGGSEVAYWLQLKTTFHHYNTFFPALILRQSFLWADKHAVSLQAKTGLSDKEMFWPSEQLTRYFVQKHSNKDLELEEARRDLSELFDKIKNKAVAVDDTLRSSAEAALTKMRYQVDIIEKKMMRAEKRNMAEELARIYKLKALLFPNNSLQERYETFMPYFISKGFSYFDNLLEATRPYGDSFVLIKEMD